jgi:hypothetical protein
MEDGARLEWRSWGHAFALFTKCSECGEVVHCRGRKRDRMLCLNCFDVTPVKKR